MQRVGPDWCLAHGAAQDWVVRLPAVVAVAGARRRAVPEVAWSPVARLGFGSACAAGGRGRASVVHGTDGTAREGVVARVGADFVEVTVGEGRSLLLARDTIAAVQSRG